MRHTTLDVRTGAGDADAYLVTPDGPGPFPGVLMYMDAFGLRPRLAEMATRIAEHGYAVLVPNLFHRIRRSPLGAFGDLHDPQARSAAFQVLIPMIRSLTPGLIAEDTRWYLDFLAGHEDVAEAPVFLVGYCMGGRNALLAAQAHPDRIAGLASFHAGGLVTDRPNSPHLAVGSLRCPAYFGHADSDRSMTADQIRTLEAALAEAGVEYVSELYEGAPHGFSMSDTAMYDEAAERRHWDALLGMLRRVSPVG